MRAFKSLPVEIKVRDFSQKMLERCFTCPELGVRCGGTNVEMELIRQKNPEFGNPYCVY